MPFDPDTDTPPKNTEGWSPVYAEDAMKINVTEPKDIENGGKIYVKGSIFYQIEAGKGIHVVDISNPQNPVKLKFIHVAGCQEISILGNTLYTNNVNDLVCLNIADINHITEMGRTPDAFHIVNKSHPPSRGWFECIDASKGEVIGWELKTLASPKCVY